MRKGDFKCLPSLWASSLICKVNRSIKLRLFVLKVFNCPANLASHRRWHKPRPNNQQKLASGASPTKPKINNSDEDAVKTDQSSEAGYTCKDCGKMFRR